ncbi:MAG: hypothetical protein QOI88_4691 [Gammaproteobacteria bacterium]|jgi:hypothetical protein|nr:hypothetical protein [Gammaproteobacteria bacterium]
MLNKLLIPARAIALGVILSAASLPAAADSASDAKLEELQHKLDQSMKMIEALGARVKELEGHATSGPVAAAAAPAADAQRLAAVEQQVVQIETVNATRQSDDSGLPIHGFADVNVGNDNLYFPYAKGTNVGSLDLYLAPKLGDRVVSLAELIFETGPDGHVGTDLERFQIGYQFSDKATVWVGRFHTPYGYVNTALHHGVWLADALRRPKFVNFEDKGGVLPAHTVGVWVTGAQHEGNGKFLYDFYAGNGQQIQGGTLDMQTGGNGHGAAIAGTRLSYQFSGGAVDGLMVGVNGFTDKVSDDRVNGDLITPNATLIRLNMVGAYAVYDTDMWEHIVEFYSFRDKTLNGSPGTHKSNAWFGQFAYRGRWCLPYVRFERASLDQADPYFNEQTFGASYYRSALGVRFDINAKSSIKLEVAHTRNTDDRPKTDYRPSDAEIGLPQQYNEILAQYAVRF